MVSHYEKQRALNMQRNTELLKSLGLDQPLFEPKEKPQTYKKIAKKRKVTVEVEDNLDISVKAPRLSSDVVDPGIRRSSRNIGRTVDYKSEHQRSAPMPLTYISGANATSNVSLLKRGVNKREYDPKTFGSIPGTEVGTWWLSREECSNDSIHAPWVAGISGGPDGAYSVALSGGYDDDIDLGYAFTYTGSGGRDLKGTKEAPKNLRTAPQSSDQSFGNSFNQALKRSSETGKPVRVIRGYKLKSQYAPSEGYRYDGLYTVEKAWMEKGLNPGGYLVCKYAFKRLPGQPPLPIRSEVGDDERSKTDDKDNSCEKVDN